MISRKFCPNIVNLQYNRESWNTTFIREIIKLPIIDFTKFFSYLGNLAHWKEVHPEQEVIYKCQELDRTTQQPCHFTSKESEDIFKHRSKHKIRETPQEVKPEATVE